MTSFVPNDRKPPDPSSPMTLFPTCSTRPAFLILAGCALAILFSFLGRLFWFFDLFAHFHLQYSVVLLGVATLFAVLRERILLAASIMLLVPSLVHLSYYFPSHRTPPSAADPPPLKVVSFNLLTTNSRHREVLHHLQGVDADVIVLIEVGANWLEHLKPLEASHPFHEEFPREDNFGIALYSRIPFLSQQHINLPPEIPVVAATIDWNGGPITIIGAHPLPPISPTYALLRNDYLTQLADFTRRTGTPTILMGDLNTTPWSHTFKNLTSTAQLRDSGKHRGFHSTWKRSHPFFSLPLDHILHTPDLVPVDHWIGPDLGSDHRPVGAWFQRKGKLR